ncbi:DNA alkylation response protein [Actinomadura viridis]|uniref:Alkylation response protein AidB-like acyl-CoA dehydrogenase n=1 Tax=Actinomadura viridis TaxID=58110 RepID=A0A931DQ11_9ACTN|nr:acyl-CoA dehydrogenase family protein [Actinomadura viridis]MBG6091917.1 alkylation response protein AidB-like acyl-CoA dehydrogenase [Actinomadura viridis]
MASYLIEPVDRLPFGGPDKARRYATERYRGAAGLNWYTSDPTLRFLMRRHLGADGLAWAEPRLAELGALMGGPIAERAEETDRNPPRLEKYDRWGHDVSRVVMPPSFEAARDDLVATSFIAPRFIEEARAAGVDPAPLGVAWHYLLDQADIGMACALGTGGDMVVGLSEMFAPEDVKARVRELFAAGQFSGEAAQMLTERSGGSDLGALESTATPEGDAWRLNGFKWFASNANGSAFVVLAKPEGAVDGVRGIAPFLVLRERRDGSRNGVRIRRLKDKLGTRSVASAEIEFTDAEAFLLAPSTSAPAEGQAGDGKGLARMMELTNGARLAIATMGLGCARRALVESLCYTRTREAFGAPLRDQPLMRRKLAELIVETEAAQALVFDGYLGRPRLRLGAALAKLRAARLGVTAASDAIEIHGGNGYIEQWPVARILRDAQVNPIWEGGDNILCLDVRRAMRREGAHLPFLERLEEAAGRAPAGDDATAALVRRRAGDLRRTVERWSGLDEATAEARLYPLAQYMADVYAAALLLEQAGWERDELGTDRKALVARLYAGARLADPDPLRGIDGPAEDLERFKDLVDGALVDDRS